MINIYELWSRYLFNSNSAPLGDVLLDNIYIRDATTIGDAVTIKASEFDAFDPSRTIKLMQAEKTPELTQYMQQISGVVNYVNQTFSLFNEVEKVRPKKILSRK